MTWIAAVLAIFLFYKFVERAHKIIVFKIVGVCAVLAGLSAGGFALYDNFRPHNKTKKIRVEPSYHLSSADPNLKVKLAEKLFQQLKKKFNSYALHLNAQEEQFAKYILFKNVKFNNDYRNKIVQITKEESAAFQEMLSNEGPARFEAEKKYTNLQEARLRNLINETVQSRPTNLNGKERTLYAYKLWAIQDSLFERDFSEQFKNNLTKEELRLVNEIGDLREDLSSEWKAAINETKNNSEVGFSICNDEDIELLSYSFYASGFVKGRSTPHPIRREDYGSSTRFEGDIIVPPNTCSTFQWSGPYNLFDNYKVETIIGNWKEGS